MAKTSSLKAALKADEEEFVLMGNTRALFAEIWNHWRQNLGHTPEVAKRMMDAAIKEIHTAEIKKPKKQKKSSVKAKVKKLTAKKMKPVKASKRKSK